MRLLLLFSSIFFMSPELIFANIDIVLFKKASINKIYSSNIVFLNPGDKFRFLIRSDKNDKINVTTYREGFQKSSTGTSSTPSLGSMNSSSSNTNDIVSETGFRIKRLKLPRGVCNIRIRLNTANPCSIGWRSKSMVGQGRGSILVMAGIRRDIFVWDLNKEEILR